MKNFIRPRLILPAVLGFAAGILLFFPFEPLCDLAAMKVIAGAAQNGAYVSFNEAYAEGVLDKVFVCRGIGADFPVFRITAEDLRIDPAFARSLLSKSFAARVYIGSGEITPMVGSDLKWTGGSADLSVGNGGLVLRNIRIDGDLSVRGDIEFSAHEGKILRADLSIRVPHETDRMLQMAAASGIVPLHKGQPGEWRVEK